MMISQCLEKEARPRFATVTLVLFKMWAHVNVL